MTDPTDVFAAIADGTRRQIFETLAISGPATATGLAGDLNITRQAVAKHLAILAAAGMANSERIGRETRFEAEPTSLKAVETWIAQVDRDWQHRLAALASSLDDLA